jgi:hypothetical protein
MIERALDATVSLDSERQPLAKFVTIPELQKLRVVIEVKALDEAGIGLDTAVDCHVSQITLRSALSLALTPLTLTYLVKDGLLSITTWEQASSLTMTQTYQVDDLVRSDRADTGSPNYSALATLMTSTVQPATWDEVGGPGTMRFFQGALVIDQTYGLHRDIAHTLAALRECRSQNQRGDREAVWAESPAQRAVRRRFEQSASLQGDFDFREVTLSAAVAAIGERFKLQLMLDRAALEEAGIGDDTPVTMTLRSVSPPIALDRVLRPLELTCVIHDEVGLVTTVERDSTMLSVVIHPVDDLVHAGAADKGQPHGFGRLMDVITSTTRPNTWDEVGGPGTISPFSVASCLAIGQTGDAQTEIARLMAALRTCRTPAAAAAEISSSAAEQRPRADVVTRLYRLPTDTDHSAIAEAIREMDAGNWEEKGFRLRISGNSLVVRQTRRMQQQIDEFLNRKPAAAGGVGSGMF